MAQNSTGRPDNEGPLVEQHVADNYDRLHREGREYPDMADQAERMGDRALAAHLRQRADSGTEKDTPPAGRRASAKGSTTS